MYALVDCNDFYASCERVFQPGLRQRPIIVLSNNDGCVIARSAEAKALGIGMGVPCFRVREPIERHGIVVFSSNYTLYGDLSARVMSILSGYAPRMEVYSIDEAFLDLSGCDDLIACGRAIVAGVRRASGIPVSMGIAATKTLAKVANRFAKKFAAYKGVCLIGCEEQRREALRRTAIGDVWGIGRQHGERLRGMGITNAHDFSRLPAGWVVGQMTIVGLRTWQELNGIACIDLDLAPSPKKQICTSRSFGDMLTDVDELCQAIASFAGIGAEKLRRQNSCAAALTVFAHTNRFRTDLPQCWHQKTVEFPTPTSSSFEIVREACNAMRAVYRDGYRYGKAGVIMNGIVDETSVQPDLFDAIDSRTRARHARLMAVMDQLNASPGFGGRPVFLASQGLPEARWKLRNQHVSRCYTTRPADFITVRAG